LDVTGSGWAWGYNYHGELGDGTNLDRWTPVQVTGLIGGTEVSCGYWFMLVRRSDGTVCAWGFNLDGLGDRVHNESWTPMELPELLGVTAISAGREHALAVAPMVQTTAYTIDREAIITEAVALRGYLRRLVDGLTIIGREMRFDIDGTPVGSAVTDATRRATLLWTITDGRPAHTITAEFARDASYPSSSATAVLTALTVNTKTLGYDRAGRITEYTTLRATLWRTDNTPVVGKTVTFSIDGTPVGSGVTNPTGRALIGYTIDTGGGAGTRVILADWAGDGGFRPSSATSTLYVSKAAPYVWVLSKSVPHGGIANLYAYFRRLDDLQKQTGKDVVFSIDGTPVGAATADASAVARYLYHTTEPPGTYAIRCEFAGDAYVEAGYGEANLTIY